MSSEDLRSLLEESAASSLIAFITPFFYSFPLICGGRIRKSLLVFYPPTPFLPQKGVTLFQLELFFPLLMEMIRIFGILSPEKVSSSWSAQSFEYWKVIL